MKININGVEYKIVEVSQKAYKEYRKKEDKYTACDETNTSQGVYYGASHHYVNTIFLDKSLPLDRKRKTLIHELTHCYISEHITHEEKSYTEEDVADINANSHDFIHNVIENYFDKK